MTSISNSCIKATIFIREEAFMDKFLVIDLDMDIRTARSHFEKKYILAKLPTTMLHDTKVAHDLIFKKPCKTRTGKGR